MPRLTCALGLMLVLAAPAFAKDVCFVDNANFPNQYAFHGMKIPLKGRSTPIAGVFIAFGGKPSPIQGSLYRNKADGKFLIGIVVHSSLQTTNDFSATWTGDAFTLAGTAKIDTDGNNTGDGSLVLTPTSCREIELP
jgi:hypothetical protein